MKATVKRIPKSAKKLDKIYSAVEQNQTTSDEIINSSDTVSENQPNEVIIDTAKIDRNIQLEQLDWCILILILLMLATVPIAGCLLVHFVS